ncbi:TetR/AcrR family transcriptional regulator [Brachybacterium sp. AOP43-C2-M15]|uniref:TetR/AcrR family transcriptional regulator n=1 Tax=Brachybacterium sp. AOP43-C2-M15 TaxID=3457661 RepID=UPI0040348E2F
MAEKNETGLPRAVMIAWGMVQAPQRGPSRGLSHERIVAAGIEIADAEGLAAVTMQAVAGSLGFTTMSLYRYVSNKEELLRLMQDTALKLPEAIELPAGWREGMGAWALLVRDAYRAHPWALEIPRGQVSVLMPYSMHAAELGMRALAELEVDDESKLGVILVVSQLAASMVALERSLADEGLVAATGEGVALLSEVITAERFPHVHRLYGPSVFGSDAGADGGAPVLDDSSLGVDDEYLLGVDLLLDGLEERQARSQGHVGTSSHE